MPPGRPQKYTQHAPQNNNAYWDQFIPPQPVVQPRPQQQPTADILRPTQQAPVVQGPPVRPVNQWLPLLPPPSQPQQPTADILRPTAPIQGPQPQPLQPNNQWLPIQPAPIAQPQQWRPELIQTGFATPDIGAPQIGQSGTFQAPVNSSLNNFNQAVMQGPQPRPSNYNPYLNQPPRGQPQQQSQGWGAASTGLVNQAFDTAINFINDDPFMKQNGYQLQPFSESAASRQMDYYNQQLDERRPYGTASVWDMWKQVQEGAQQIGEGALRLQSGGQTWQESLQNMASGAAQMGGGAITVADSPRNTAVGYAATAPLVGAVNASQAAQRYIATRQPGDNTVGEYISSYGGAALSSILEAVNRTGNLNPLNPGQYITDTANKTLQQFQNAGTLTPQEQQKLAAIDPTLPAQVQQDVKLNYGTVQSQKDTRDQLVQKYTAPSNYEADAARLMSLAASATDKGDRDSYLEQAALAGYKAYKAKNTNPYEIVDSNTSWQQMLMEVAAPDPLFDGVGAVFKGLGMLGEPAAKIFGTAKERRMLKSADQFINNVGDLAVDIEKLGLSPNVTQAFPKHSKVFTWTSGTVKAQQDAYNMSKAVIGLLSDVDNTHDARILLNIMSDSKALARAIKEGIPYQLLHSPLLRNLADESGKVRLGFGAFADKGVQNGLKTWASTAKQFLQESESLKNAQKFDKVQFVSEFIDTVREAGYARYGVAKAVGKGAQTNYANVLSSMMQRTMSTFQIKLNPGSWVRDVVASAGMAMGDGVFAGFGDWRKTINAMYPNMVPSMLVEGEKLAGAAITEQQALNKGFLSRIPKPSAPIEENLANNIFAKSVLDLNKRYIPKALNSSLAPLLKSAGVDQRTTNAIINNLTHVMMTQGKAEMVKEFDKIVSGISKPFDLKQYAGQIDNLLTVDELDEIYKTVRTAPTPEAFQQSLNNILDKAQERYAQRIIESPIAPQRYDWTNIELSQDAGDFAQGAEMAVRQGGLDLRLAQQATQEAVAAAEKEKGLLDTLVQFVTDSQDPNARYALYNVWAQRQELLVSARVQLSEMAEDVIARGGGDLWSNEYFPAARAMWSETRSKIEAVINDAKRLLNEGQDLSQNYSAWGQLERVARSDEAKAMAGLMLEPQSAKYNGEMLREVMAAKRAIEDRAAARAYAAARRTIGGNIEATTDVMDVLVSADRDIMTAGAKVRTYLNQQFARLMGENGRVSSKGWEQYFSLRNAKWREHTEYAVARWRAAESQATLHGKGTGLVWSDPFTTAPKGKNVGQYNETLELVGQASKPGHWWVRTPEGNHILMPDHTVKTAKPKVPTDIIEQYKNGYKQTELVTEDELDNIMSGFVVFDNAETVNFAKAEQEAAKTARDSMRSEWDRVAKANYGLPGIDQMILQYKRNGFLNMNVDSKIGKGSIVDYLHSAKGEEWRVEGVILQPFGNPPKYHIVNVKTGQKRQAASSQVKKLDPFRDLYGNVIGGMQINSATDVERFLQGYSGLAEKAKTAKATKLEETVIKLDEMPPLWAWNDPDFTPPAGLTKQRHEEIVAMMEQALIEQSERVGAAGAAVPAHLGHMSTQGVEQVANLRQQLMNAYSEYAKMTPNKVNEAMQLQLYQAFRQQAVPAIDNVLTAAANYGDKMRSFVVPDRLNKTRVDELLALVMPYHFWFTRTAKNAVERMIYEPGTFRRLNQLQQNLPLIAADAQGIEKDPNAPARFNGAVPIQIGDKTYYAYLDLGQFMPNMVSMLANKFASPDTSEGGLQYALESMQSLGFGMYPFLADAVGVMSGTKSKQDVRPLGYFPLGRTLAWEASNIFGVQNVPANLRAGNEEYVIGRQVSNMAQRGEITPEEAGFAMDYLRQLYAGDNPLPEQQMLVPDDRMQAIIQQATQAATLENRQKYVSGFSGTSVTPYDTTESQILGAQNQYFGSQYPANPYGGKTATGAILDQNPGLVARWGQKAITDETKDRPGLGAAKQAMYGDQKELKDSLTQAGSASVDAAIAANPAITKKEMYAARLQGTAVYAASVVGKEALDAWLLKNPEATASQISSFVVDTIIAKQYPSVYDPNYQYAPNMFTQSNYVDPGVGLPPDERVSAQQQAFNEQTYGMNPVEQGIFKQEQAVNYAAYNFPGEPVYKEGDKSYFAAKDAWDQEKTSWLATELGVSEEEAAKMLKDKKNENKSDAEVQRLDDIQAEQDRRDAEYAQRKIDVVGKYGDEAGVLWEQYYNLPKGEARDAFTKEHPEMKVYNMYAYNRKEYSEAASLFGEDAWMEWAKAPASGDTEEAKAARNNYFQEHLNAKVLSAWLTGRPMLYDERKVAGIYYNFGGDYYEAQKLFGAGIFDLYRQYDPRWSKAQKAAFYRAHPEYGDFTDWWYGNEKKQRSGGGGRRSGGGGGGGGGGYSRPAAINQDRYPSVYSQGLSQGLAATGSPQAWRPQWIQMPRVPKTPQPKPWKAINVKRIAG